MPHAWIKLLRDAVAEEFNARPAIATLATVSEDGSPAARSVVCRSVSEDGSIVIVSDARSRKNRQLRRDPRGELVFWLPGQRVQFRVAGRIEIVSGGPSRDDVWKRLTDASRALFFWPAPEEAFDASETFVKATADTVPAPSNFEVLILRAEVIEHLDLNSHPHDRRRYAADDDWRERRLNP